MLELLQSEASPENFDRGGYNFELGRMLSTYKDVRRLDLEETGNTVSPRKCFMSEA